MTTSNGGQKILLASPPQRLTTAGAEEAQEQVRQVSILVLSETSQIRVLVLPLYRCVLCQD